MGRAFGRRRLGALLHRALAERSLFLGRGARRRVVFHEAPGGQLGDPLDPAGRRRTRTHPPADRGLPRARRGDRPECRDHRHPCRRRPRRRARRPRRGERRCGRRRLPGRAGGDRRVQLEPRHGPRCQARPRAAPDHGGVRAQRQRLGPCAGPRGGRLPDPSREYLALRICDARLPRCARPPRPRVPRHARLHMGQPAGGGASTTRRCRAAPRGRRRSWRRTRATPGRSSTPP